MTEREPTQSIACFTPLRERDRLLLHMAANAVPTNACSVLSILPGWKFQQANRSCFDRFLGSLEIHGPVTLEALYCLWDWLHVQSSSAIACSVIESTLRCGACLEDGMQCALDHIRESAESSLY